MIDPRTESLQAFCDRWLGLDCSGFVTNWFLATGRRTPTDNRRDAISADNYYSPTKAVQHPNAITRGHVLVLMANNQKCARGPGHVALVQSIYPFWFSQQNRMEVVEATSSSSTCPCASTYEVKEVIEPGSDGNQVLILKVQRFGKINKFAVMAW